MQQIFLPNTSVIILCEGGIFDYHTIIMCGDFNGKIFQLKLTETNMCKEVQKLAQTYTPVFSPFKAVNSIIEFCTKY